MTSKVERMFNLAADQIKVAGGSPKGQATCPPTRGCYSGEW